MTCASFESRGCSGKCSGGHSLLEPQLHSLFHPNSVAVIGATERPGSVGRTVLANLMDPFFPGAIFPVSRDRDKVLGLQAYPSVSAIHQPIDLAILVVPAVKVPDLVSECAAAGVKNAIVISAGFKETGGGGKLLEQDISRRLANSKMRLIGPNCLGVMNPRFGLNATFANAMALPGKVAFLSQSGALCTAILDWSLKENFGFSSFVSVGSMLDVDWADLILYFGNDEGTNSILIYMESISDAPAFLAAAREVTRHKPIILIKAGKTEAAAKAAASHTGAMTCSDDVLDAALEQNGVLRVNRIAELFYMSELLSKQPLPCGNRLAIVTNAGGPGVLATDALMNGGGQLASLSDQSLSTLNASLPAHWSHGNPIDILGDASPERYKLAVKLAMHDPNSDGVLAIMAPQGMTDPAGVAEELKQFAKNSGKPLLACLMGGKSVEGANATLNDSGIPTFEFPDTAAQAFNYLRNYSWSLRAAEEHLEFESESITDVFNHEAARQIIESARSCGRTLLSEMESKDFLNAYHIPTVATYLAKTEEEAILYAGVVGYPVVLKLHSHTITHKSDVHGVRLGLQDVTQVHEAFRGIKSSLEKLGRQDAFQGVTVQPMVQHRGYELIVGSSLDPQFGPVVLFGAGGELAEILQDHSLALPPLTPTIAKHLIERTRISKALNGIRGKKPVDLQALEELLIHFSHMVIENPEIQEVEINPLLATETALVALDARVVLRKQEVTAPLKYASDIDAEKEQLVGSANL